METKGKRTMKIVLAFMLVLTLFTMTTAPAQAEAKSVTQNSIAKKNNNTANRGNFVVNWSDGEFKADLPFLSWMYFLLSHGAIKQIGTPEQVGNTGTYALKCDFNNDGQADINMTINLSAEELYLSKNNAYNLPSIYQLSLTDEQEKQLIESGGDDEDFCYYKNVAFVNLKMQGTVQAKASGNSIIASWNACGATGYDVYYRKTSAPTWSKYTSVKGSSATIKGLANSSTYAVRIVPYATIEGKSYYGSGKDSALVKMPAVTAQSKISLSLYGYNDVKVAWNKQSISGMAAKYKVEYKKASAKKYTVLSKGTTASFIKKANLSSGTKYTFRVTPYATLNGKKHYGVAKVASIYTLNKVKASVKKASAGKVKVSWKNINGESGYQIAKAAKKNKKYTIVKTVGYKTSSCVIKVTKKKNYYYKVRAYSTVAGKKVYGPWSSVKSYKLK